jgi:hypothetical protein
VNKAFAGLGRCIEKDFVTKIATKMKDETSNVMNICSFSAGAADFLAFKAVR